MCSLRVSFAFFPTVHSCTQCVLRTAHHIVFTFSSCWRFPSMWCWCDDEKLLPHVLLPLLSIRFSLHERFFCGVWLEYFPWIILGEFNMQVCPPSTFIATNIPFNFSTFPYCLACRVCADIICTEPTWLLSPLYKYSCRGAKGAAGVEKWAEKPDLSRLMFASSFPV